MKLTKRSFPLVLIAAVAVLGGTARADYQSTINADNPAGYWRLGELNAGQAPVLNPTDTAANSGGIGAPATGYYLYNAGHGVPGSLAGSSDTAAGFDGNRSRLDVPFVPELNTTNFTVEMWVRLTNPTGNRAVSPFTARDTNAQRGVLFFANNTTTKWQFRTHAGGTGRNISSTNDVQYNTWVHLVGTHENGINSTGSVMRLYVNGQLAAAPLTNALNSYTPNTAAPLRIGGGNNHSAIGDFFWPGHIDEVAIYTNALPAAQILAHYENGTNASRSTPYETLVTTDGAVAYYRLNETAGTGPVPTPTLANAGSLGSAANGFHVGVTNSAAPIPWITNNLSGGAGLLTADANPALQFNGRGGMGSVPYQSELNPASFSVEYWARLDGWANAHQAAVSAREGRILQTGAGVQEGFIFYAAPSGGLPRLEFWTGPGWNSVTGPTMTIGQTYHVVGTYDAATKTKLFYVDGQIVGGAVNVTVVPNSGRQLQIGAGENENGAGNFFWNGAVDEVAVYPGVLTPSQVGTHFQAGKGSAPAVTTAPTIPVNPANTTNWAPYSVALNAVVLGSLPMQLQWYKVSPDLTTTNLVAGATNVSLVLNPTSTADIGYYYLTATNTLGGAESLQAYVEIIPPTPPAITLDLAAETPVYVNGTAGLYAAAVGTPPITYLLLSNSVEVATSTNGVFRLPGVQYAQSNVNYVIKATNLFNNISTATTKLSVLTPKASSYAAVATGLNPMGYWRLGEPFGTAAFDYWGGWHGDYTGAGQDINPGALVDDDDGCVQVYGSGSYTRTRTTTAFNFTGTTNKFSFAAWINASSWPATGVRFFSNRRQVGGTGGYGFGIWNGNSYRFTAFGVTDVAQGLPTVILNQWYHVACVNSNQTVYFYLNGAFVGTGNGNHGGINTSPYPLQLGGNPNYNTASDEEPFNGMMDEALVFNRILTATEIKALYDARYGSLVPPSIVKQPDPAQVFVGGAARFTVEAIGSSPLTYQWKTNGIAIPGATNASVTVPSVTTDMSGVNYSVTVQNVAGTSNSLNALLTVLTPSGFVAAVTADNPEAIWRLGETAGSLTAFDSWGAHNGAVVGGVTFGGPGALVGEANTSASFDGASKVEVPYAAELNAPLFTVECWARVTGGSGFRSPVSARNEVQGGSQGGFIIYATADNQWSFWTGSSTGWQALNGPAVVENQWTHLVATYDGTTKRFYVNGVLAASVDTAVVQNPLRALRIGAGRNEMDPGDYYFMGDIDEVSVYSHALSADRVAYHYNLGVYGTTTPPFIIRNPSPLSLVAGSTAAFSAQAGGSPALLYQWFRGASPVAGATTRSLLLTNAQYSDAGDYILRVTNALGYAESLPASLFIGPPPTFAYLTNDLVLHLKFDGNVQDSSGRGNHGTIMGNPTFVLGRLGQALHYETQVGVAYDYVSLGTPTDLLFSSNVNFSVSYWARFTGTPGDLPFLCSAVQSYSNFGVTFAPAYTNGGWSWSLGDTTGYVGVYGAANSINNGQWHHLVHTFNRTGAVATAVTYLDGVQVDARSAAAVGDIDSGWPFTIGQDPTGSYGESAAADIDDLGIWRKALSAYEAQSIFGAASFANQSFDVAGPAILQIRNAGDMLEIIWQGGVLHESSTLTGTYTPVSGAVPPYYKVAAGPGQKFYKVQPVNP